MSRYTSYGLSVRVLLLPATQIVFGYDDERLSLSLFRCGAPDKWRIMWSHEPLHSHPPSTPRNSKFESGPRSSKTLSATSR